MICYELAVGEHPFQGYPVAYTPPPNLSVDLVDTTVLTKLSFPTAFVTTITSLLHTDPYQRMDISEAHTLLQSILNADTNQ